MIIYLFLAIIVFCKRKTMIYSHLPALFGRQSAFLFDLLLATLLLTVLICIIQETRCPFWIKVKVDRAFQRAGLKNGIGENPVLISIDRDLRRAHGKRYTINNKGIPIEAMAEKKDSLEQNMGIIYELSDSRKPGYTYLYVLPGISSPPYNPKMVFDHDF